MVWTRALWTSTIAFVIQVWLTSKIHRYLGIGFALLVLPFSMGSTATAMANMQAITAKYGPAPQSYLIVPLAGAFFIDLMNAFLLTFILALPFMGGGT